jgi:transcription elongation factor Elf1
MIFISLCKEVKVKEPRDKILCPFCGKMGKKSSHHILPKRNFGNVGRTVLICRACHDELENLIRKAEVLPAEKYIEIFETFEKRKRQR